ncbi:MAG: exodeoxyribonuclease VII large subunit [Balneolaceae bacterium]
MSDSTLTVSEFTNQIRSLLEPRFDRVEVRGELSNVNRSRNGHLYMTLKDSDAQLPVVMWRNRVELLDRELQDGDEVILSGGLQIYPPHGRYQLIVQSARIAGEGRLQIAFERLKKKLLSEGLFEESVKRSLPPFPRKIAVITSSTGAAFHDIRSTLERRWPLAELLLIHASVQGDRAAGELVLALQHAKQRSDLDLLVIGRGGGSIEDLWPFNEESVARALYQFPVPTISAVGHETDFSITDFVADKRAATPTQAALMATPDQNELRLQIDDRSRTLGDLVRRRMDRSRDRVRFLGESHALRTLRTRMNQLRQTVQWQRERLQRLSSERIPLRRQRLEHTKDRLVVHLERRFQSRQESLLNLHHRLERKDPNEPLDRGFVRVWQFGSWVVQPDRVHPDKELELEWKNGRLRARTHR